MMEALWLFLLIALIIVDKIDDARVSQTCLRYYLDRIGEDQFGFKTGEIKVLKDGRVIKYTRDSMWEFVDATGEEESNKSV